MSTPRLDRGRTGRFSARLEKLADPFSLGKARTLLEDGSRREALETLDGARERARCSVPAARWYSGNPDDEILVEESVDALRQIRSLALDAARDGGWGSWEDDVVDGFAALAARAEQDAAAIRAEALATSQAKRERRERRRLHKAVALCASLPLWAFVSLGFSGAPAGHPSTPAVAATVAESVVLASIAAAVTVALWRRRVRSDLLYGPFWVGLVGAIAVAAVALS